MESEQQRIKWRIICPYIISLLATVALCIYVGDTYHHEQLKREIAAKAVSVEQLFEKFLAQESKFMQAQLGFLTNDPALKDVWRQRDRAGLYQAVSPMYQRFNRKYGVTHFYFIEPDRTCFLRVHQPERNGDLIDRHTMLQAKNTGRLSYGIELGPLGTFTLRVVSPWMQGDTLVGYIELGEEIEHLSPYLQEISGLDFIFTINKNELERKGWETGNRMLGKDERWDDFKQFVIIDKTVGTLDRPLRTYLSAYQNDASSGQDFDINGRMHHVFHLPLSDASGKRVGSLFVLYDISDDIAALQEGLQVVILLVLVTSLVVITFFYFFVGRIERRILQYQENLEGLVEKRTAKLQQALAEIKTLSGLLPICASCKKIRDDNGYWEYLEKYITRHSEAQFSHGICPDCAEKLYPDLMKQIKESKDKEIAASAEEGPDISQSRKKDAEDQDPFNGSGG